jgi:hypothetical protein
VQCFVEAALYAGLVTGELGEGVRAVAVPYEGQTELRRVRIPHVPVGFLNEYACLHPAQSPKPPVGGDDPIDEEVLQLSDRLKLGPQVFVQLPQLFLVLSRQENLLRAQAVLEGVEADGVLPLRRLGPVLFRAFRRLASAFFSLVMISIPSVVFVSMMSKEL